MRILKLCTKGKVYSDWIDWIDFCPPGIHTCQATSPVYNTRDIGFGALYRRQTLNYSLLEF